MRRLLAVAVIGMLAVSACASSGRERVVVAAGTTVVDSGLIERLVDVYESTGGSGAIDVIGLSSQQSLVYAAAGNADVTITHEPGLLASFRAENPQAVSAPVFTSRFVYVSAPGLAFPRPTVESILETVAADAITFVSRDDGSGTYAKEQAMWRSAGIDPSGAPWYIRTGTGMGDTLLVTAQRNGVTLAEEGAYLAASDDLSLVPADDGTDERLTNPYTVTLVDPAGNDAAVEFFAWLTSPPGRDAISTVNNELFGTQVYRLP